MRMGTIFRVLIFFCLSALTAQDASASRLARTGQAVSYAGGDDGAIQMGVVWPVPRFINNGDGTVSDNLTGLTWLQNANCFGSKAWTAALTSANTLASGACGLTDGSAAGDWALPNVEQMASLTDISKTTPALPSGHPFSTVQSSQYWSSATYVSAPASAWYVDASYGSVSYSTKTSTYYVWPVRAGQFLLLDSLTVSLKGSPFFGSLAPGGTTATREVTLRNQGAAELTVTSVALTGSNPTDFSVAPGGSAPCASLSPTLAAGEICTVAATFTSSYGPKNASLTVTAGGRSVDLPVSGTTLPPDTTITDKPAAFSNNATPSFSFTSAVAGSTFECKLDSGSFAACTTPKGYSGLAEGSHTFSVRAVDPGGGVDPSPASWTWTQDLTAPDTTINNKPPALTNSATASFAFFSNDTTATFQCDLDGGGFAACTTPWSYSSLSSAGHTFQVRAVDLAGNPDPTPASYTWTVDNAPPDTSIETEPTALTNATSATFTFSATETNSTFECRLDSESFATCTSPKSYAGLAEGSHTFEARATDPAGNIDPTPAAFTWVIDTQAPTVSSFTLPGTASSLNVTFSSFTATDSVGVTGYLLSESATTPLPGDPGWTTTQPAGFTFATEGSKSLYAFAGDGAGNISLPANAIVTISLPRTLTVTRAGAGSGAVSSAPAGIDCGGTCANNFTSGSQVTLSATADSGSTFSGWTGEGCSTGTCLVTMNTDKNVTATFISSTQLLTLNQAGTGTGTVAASPAGASGTPHNGTLINSPAWTAGKYGNGLSLSNGQYVSVPAPTPDIFNITGDLTIAMWVNPNSVTCSGADPGYALISKRSANHATPYELYISCGGSLILHYWGTNIQYPGFSSTGVITTGVWQHVAATRSFSGSNATITFFINGVEAGSSTQNTGPALGSSDPLWISRDGYHTGYTSQGSYSGLIDEVQMYNRSVSAAEVARIYANTSDALPNRLGNWKLDESSGTTAADTVTLSCVGNCSDTYTNGSVVTLSTAPGTGSVFSGWSGNTDCSDGLVTMDADKSCTATFNLTVNGACGISNGGTFISVPSIDLCTYGTPTTVNGSGPWTWNCTGFYGGTTADCAASIQTYTLTITKTGTGIGTVTSVPAGINCGATCSAAFNYGTAVVLFQTPETPSGFSGWGNACSGTGDCGFSMSSEKGVSADFTSSPMVKNQRTGVAYSLLQTACSEALHGDTIMALTTLPVSGLILDASKSLIIEGGYTTDYASCVGLTPIFGPVTVKALTRVSGLAFRSLASSTKAITAFSFTSPAAEGIIAEASHTISVTVPPGTDVTALIPAFTHTGAGISPAAGVPQDFTNPVSYTVTAEDLSTQDYTVTVTVAPWAVCGDMLTYAGENYPTVQIGTQCWFAKNMNAGFFVTTTSAPDTSCSSVQKFCYGNSEGNCSTYGGLYTWTQAMCGAQIESAQGLCPSGWHVPSDAEFVTLANFLGPGGCAVKPGGNYPNTFCGAPAGDRLKATELCQGRTPCGDSGFNSLLGGAFGYSGGPVFSSIGAQGSFWTSSGTGGGEAWRRGVALDYSGVDGSYFWTSITGGRSIRCVKN